MKTLQELEHEARLEAGKQEARLETINQAVKVFCHITPNPNYMKPGDASRQIVAIARDLMRFVNDTSEED